MAKKIAKRTLPVSAEQTNPVVAQDSAPMATEAASPAEVDLPTEAPVANEDTALPVTEPAAPVVPEPVAELRAEKPKRPRSAKPVPGPAPRPARSNKNLSKPAKTGAKTTQAFPKIPLISQLKDTIMATTQTTDFTAMFSGVVSEAQEKAKAAFEKSAASLGDYNEFAKGNVEAIVESTKILAAGMKDLGETLAADGKSALDALTADAKELAAVKSPADFFKLQSELLRRNLDAVVAYGSKQSEAMLKLASESVAPISSRVSIAVDKVKKAA